MKKPRIAFFDIETSPNIVTTFNIKDKNPIHYQNIRKERYVICASLKWKGFKEVYSIAVDPKNPSDDTKVLEWLQEMFNQADAVVAHYGDGFDVPFIRARLAIHNLKPLAPAVQIDTYKMAKRKFLFNCNKLDYLGQCLGFGHKKSIGYETWLGCLEGNKKDIDYMVLYNRRDVVLLEKVYNRLEAHCNPAVNYVPLSDKCNHCGSSNLMKRGFFFSRTKKRQRYQCKSCGGWK